MEILILYHVNFLISLNDYENFVIWKLIEKGLVACEVYDRRDDWKCRRIARYVNFVIFWNFRMILMNDSLGEKLHFPLSSCKTNYKLTNFDGRYLDGTSRSKGMIRWWTRWLLPVDPLSRGLYFLITHYCF